MKFSKSLLAVIAMAGTMGFSAVASAMDFSVYGSLRAGLDQVSTDANATATVTSDGEVVEVDGYGLPGVTDPVTGVKTLTEIATPGTALIAANPGTAGAVGSANTEAGEDPDASLNFGNRYGAGYSRIGIMGSEDLGNGAEAGFQWESGLGDSGAVTNGRLANVWYSGAFGKLTAGQQGNPYRSAANWDQSWWQGGNNRYNDGGSRLQGIQYEGSAGAFNFSLMGTASAADDGVAAYSADFRTHGATAATVCQTAANDCSNSTVTIEAQDAETGVDSWIATGHYDMGVATINLGYQVNNTPATNLGANYDNFVISANGSLDALDWYIAFESNSDNAVIVESGGATVANAVELTTAEGVAENARYKAATTLHDTTTIGLFLGYHLSDASTIYLEWEDTANDGLDYNGDNLDRNATLVGFSRQVGPNSTFIAEYVSVDTTSEYQDNATRLVGALKVDF